MLLPSVLLQLGKPLCSHCSEYGSVCRALYKYYFFPLLLCIHPTCVGLQAPNLKGKLNKHALMAEVKTLQCYQPMRVFYLKILIRSNLHVPWHIFNRRCFQPVRVLSFVTKVLHRSGHGHHADKFLLKEIATEV